VQLNYFTLTRAWSHCLAETRKYTAPAVDTDRGSSATICSNQQRPAGRVTLPAGEAQRPPTRLRWEDSWRRWQGTFHVHAGRDSCNEANIRSQRGRRQPECV